LTRAPSPRPTAAHRAKATLGGLHRDLTGLVATVTTGYLPGLETPDRLHARLGDGRELDADGIAALVPVPDLSLAGSARDLELASVDWQAIMRSGYFGSAQRWEGYG
jgi:hypothetical protein